jgi:hypothetical protein
MNTNTVGYLIDLHISLTMRESKALVLLRSNNKEIARTLSEALKMKIYKMGNFYTMSGSSSKLCEIYNEYKDFIFLNKDKFRFLMEFLKNKPTWDMNHPEILKEYKRRNRKEFIKIEQNKLTGDEPLEYQKLYLDNLGDFQFSKMDDKYSLFWQKCSQDQDILSNYTTILKDFVYKTTISGRSTSLRAKKEESLKIVDYIYNDSFNKEFYDIFRKAANTLDMKERELLYPEFMKIKTPKFDSSLFSAETNESKSNKKIERKIAAKEERVKIKQDKANKLEQKKIIRKEKLELKKQETIERNLLRNKELKIQNEKERALKLEEIESEILQGFKTCRTCTKTKPLEFFHKQPSNLGGYHHHCKSCSYLNSRDLEKNRERTRKWQSENPEKAREHRRKSKNRPIERIKSSTKARLRKYLFNKAEAGITYKEIIGCTPKELQTHLTNLFSYGMSWDNYGTIWDVDHIIPCRAFDQTKKNHVVKCWNYKNLRPMIKASNYFKSDLLPNGQTARFMAKSDPVGLEQIRDKMLLDMGIGLIENEIPCLDLTKPEKNPLPF